MTPYQNIIYKSKYSRFIPSLGRREDWGETVQRYFDFMKARAPETLYNDLTIAKTLVEGMEVMPSMRALWSAGDSLSFENAQAYNCGYTAIKSTKDFGDLMYLLMCGCGIGFSVESMYVDNLASVPPGFAVDASYDIKVEDSREGWAKSTVELLDTLYAGYMPNIDYTAIRERGAILKTSGGRASGFEPLAEVHSFIVQSFKEAMGRKLTSLEVYDICTHIANCVVAGGTRRSATISFSDLPDTEMANAKRGDFWKTHPHRSLSNNTVVLKEDITKPEFDKEWELLVTSGTGERGIFFESSIKHDLENVGRTYDAHRLNPCGEVILRDKEFCNLSEVIVHPDDDLAFLVVKAATATLLGMLQSTLTDFRYISPEWHENAENDRILGVSLTGLRDHPLLSQNTEYTKKALETLRHTVRLASEAYADILGISAPKSYTSIKPSGTVSQLTGVSPGLHARQSKYYIRRIRLDKNDPIAKELKKTKVPWEPSLTEENTDVFSFYMKAPETAVLQTELSALDQLEYWKLVKKNYTTHNPSVTIVVKDDEWDLVKEWVWENKPSGMSFVPPTENLSYPQLPFEPISEEEYLKHTSEPLALNFSLVNKLDKVNLEKTNGEQGCQGGACLI